VFVNHCKIDSKGNHIENHISDVSETPVENGGEISSDDEGEAIDIEKDEEEDV